MMIAVWAMLNTAVAGGQQVETSVQGAASVVTQEIKAKKNAAEADTDLPEGTLATVLELYDQAASSIVEAQRIETSAAALAARIDEATERSASLRDQIASANTDTGALEDYTLKSLSDIESSVRETEARLETARAELQQRKQRLDAILKSETTLSNEITDRKNRLRSLRQDLNAPLPANEPTALIEARHTALSARQRLRLAELQLLELQLSGHDRIVILETLERDLSTNVATRLEAKFNQLQSIADTKRKEEALKGVETAEAAKSKLDTMPAAVRLIAEKVVEKDVRLRAELEELVRKEVQVGERLRNAEQQAMDILDEFTATRRRVEFAGTTDAIGRMLRRRLAALPSLHGYRNSASERRTEISLAIDRQLDVDEQRRLLVDLDRQLDKALPAGTSDAAESVSDLANRRTTEELLIAQRESLSKLHNRYVSYISQLVALDVAERELVAGADEFAVFINERLLWIRSLPPISLSDPSDMPAGLFWLLSPANWKTTAQDFIEGARDNALILLIGVPVLLTIYGWSHGARRRLEDYAALTIKVRTDSFLHTIKALGDTVMLAAAKPAPVILVGLYLSTLPSAHSFTRTLGMSLMATAAFWLTISLLRSACRDNGLGDSHFRWPTTVRHEFDRQLGWFVKLALPLMFVFMMVNERFDQTPLVQGLGRPVYILLMIILVIFFKRLLGKNSAVTEYLVNHRAKHWTAQLRFLWYPLLLMVPLAQAAASAVGYHYTAVQYDLKGHATSWFLVAVFFVRELLLRWLYVHTRRLRFEEALRRREDARSQREQNDTVISAQDEFPPVEVPQISYSELSEKAHRLLRIAVLFGVIAGLWAIWDDLIPTFGILDAVKLPLNATEFIDGVEKTVPVTLWDLLVALFILVIVVVAAKNLSGLLEITLLQRLPLESGGRYAIVTLSQYFIVAIGVIAAFSMIGVRWSNIQWLVAALGVGLGFGLQEIVANFVSGIILLLERPIRVGDVVTVGDTSGVVSRIRIRATTIVNWNKQELIVPNKEFITGRLLNWTLSDKMNRIVINVGIAYESEVERAIDLLKEVAAEDENVLSEPVPVITFDGFGDNALSLTLRCYLSSLENRLATISALHAEINRKFREAGIVIAYPQRDVHLAIKQPIDVRLNSELNK